MIDFLVKGRPVTAELLRDMNAAAARLNAGRPLDGDLAARMTDLGVLASPRTKPWKCPLGDASCKTNCGSYGCGN